MWARTAVLLFPEQRGEQLGAGRSGLTSIQLDSKCEQLDAKGRELGVCTAVSYSTRARRSWLRGLTIVLRSVVEVLVEFVA